MQCIISEGVSSERVHRFNANGEYFAQFEPGEHSVKVICLERGLANSSSEQEPNVKCEGSATFNVGTGEPPVVTIAEK